MESLSSFPGSHVMHASAADHNQSDYSNRSIASDSSSSYDSHASSSRGPKYISRPRISVSDDFRSVSNSDGLEISSIATSNLMSVDLDDGSGIGKGTALVNPYLVDEESNWMNDDLENSHLFIGNDGIARTNLFLGGEGSGRGEQFYDELYEQPPQLEHISFGFRQSLSENSSNISGYLQDDVPSNLPSNASAKRPFQFQFLSHMSRAEEQRFKRRFCQWVVVTILLLIGLGIILGVTLGNDSQREAQVQPMPAIEPTSPAPTSAPYQDTYTAMPSNVTIQDLENSTSGQEAQVEAAEEIANEVLGRTP